MHLHTQFEGQSSVLSWEVMGHQWNGRELVVRQQIQQSHGPVQCGTLHCSQRAVWHQQNQIQSKCSPSFCKCICKSLFDSVILPCRSSARVESFSYGTPNRPEYTRSTNSEVFFFFFFFWNTTPFIPWSLLKKRWSTSEVSLEGIQGNTEETINDSTQVLCRSWSVAMLFSIQTDWQPAQHPDKDTTWHSCDQC